MVKGNPSLPPIARYSPGVNAIRSSSVIDRFQRRAWLAHKMVGCSCSWPYVSHQILMAFGPLFRGGVRPGNDNGTVSGGGPSPSGASNCWGPCPS